MNNQDHNQEWQTLTQAAKAFGRTRQAIESLVKRGVVQAKPMGAKNVMHIHVPTLQIHYASKVVESVDQSNNQSNNQVVSNVSLQIELAATKADNRRLGDLVVRLEADLQLARKEIIDERKQNKELQGELLKFSKEMQGLLKQDNGLMSWIRSKKRD
ncbi:hypothetical protein [Silvanigrella aquatica]|uniref:DUF3972 domain-containing protein n=1 Tax=Silvanigrella aquatica TaxID=1915309 RepID=A0A1L4D4Y4_9BACT|nr:hypothetical protein [Silvanigrella aquatica]APJ05259.1 hypothetical protein AXG55_14655 [Silvanigrella aquatica]